MPAQLAGSAMNDHPLKALIIGAGIGGLTAAIGLRQQGHDVEVFEKSELLREYGAAMQLAPNCTALLNRFGIDPGMVGGTIFRKFLQLTSSGDAFLSRDMTYSWDHLQAVGEATVGSVTANEQQKHYFIHRVDLHNELKRKATAVEGSGRPVKLHRGAAVRHVDCEAATLTLMDGRTVSGDIVIAADGVHSKTREIIAGDGPQPFLTGKSCCRYLTPISEIRKDPVTAKFVESPGTCLEILGGNRSIIFYPCANNTSLYTDAFLPMSEVGITEKGWGQEANKEKLLHSFSSFPSNIRALLEKAPKDGVQAWNLQDCPEIKRWSKGRAVLLGDAAHPFLPHLGQGAAMAIEDAASISALLQTGTSTAEIPRLLELFQKFRKERVDRIIEFTRKRARNFSGNEGPYPSKDETIKFVQYCTDYNEWDNTTALLRERPTDQKL